MPATANAARKKVRCPKCTALFSEPAKAIFECPICSCRLSANGAVASIVPNQGKENEFGQSKAANGVDEGSRVHSEEGSLSGLSQGTPNQLSEENRGPSPKEEQQLVPQNGELSGVSYNGGKEGVHFRGDTIEDLYASSVIPAEDNSLQESKPVVDKDEVMEGVEETGASNKRLPLQMFQTTRCEFSFKYSLKGASPVEKRLSPKFSSSETTEHNDEPSDVPLHVPLRVRISNTREESSDQSEHGRYSFGSDTDSRDGSESEFDFPAPWADGLQDKVLPDSVLQKELPQHHPKQAVAVAVAAAAAPHQLELLDVDDVGANEEYALQDSSKHFEESFAELPLQVGDAAKATSSSGREDELRDGVATSSVDQVNDFASIVSSVTINQEQSIIESSSAIVSSDQQDTQLDSSLHISSVNQESAHTYPESDARDNISDHLLLQSTEMELDLYSHPKVDEWQQEGGTGSPSRAHYFAPTMENVSGYPELQPMEGHPSRFSGFARSSTPLANSQPYVVPNPYVPDHLSFEASSSSQMYTYQVPPQRLILPPTFQNQAISPFTYHTVPNACMLCSHHQHPYMQTHVGPHVGPHCAVCVGHSGPMACTSGHADHWSYHQAHLAPAVAFAKSSLVACTPRPINLTHQYDLPSANLRLQASLPGKLSQYPPLPKDGAAPYYACKGCSRVLQVPLDLPPSNGIVQKLRCSSCGRVTKFSAKQGSRQRQVVSSLPSMELTSVGGAAYALPQVQHNAGGSVFSLDQNVVPRSSWQHDESSSKLIDTNLFTSRVPTLDSQGAAYLRGKPRDQDFDGSIQAGPSYLQKISNMTDTMSVQYKMPQSVDSIGLARTTQDAAPSLPAAVDEKDEGLDFGAPRSSDGDSLDQNDSRMRSPESIQPQRTFAGVPEDGPLGDSQAPGQMSEEPFSAYQGRKPGSPLLVLLNQESTKFRLNLDSRASTEDSESASWSPASDSPIVDSSRNRLWRKGRNSSESLKGPKYIAGLLRRSLRDFSKVGQ